MIVADQIVEQRIKTRVLEFFNGVGARVTVMRPTLSRLLSIAFPTLDLALDALVADGKLEKRDECLGVGYRVVRDHVFGTITDKPSVSRAQLQKREREAERAKSMAEAIRYREQRRVERDNEIAARIAEYERAREVKIAKRLARKAERDAKAAERALRPKLKTGPKPGTPNPLKGISRKTNLVAISKLPPITVEAAKRPPAPVDAKPAYDPWAILKARANKRPPLLPGGMEQSSTLMMGSRAR